MIINKYRISKARDKKDRTMQTIYPLFYALTDRWVSARLSTLCCFILTVALGACSSVITLPTTEPALDKKTAATALSLPSIKSAKTTHRPFEERTLYNLLIAEFAIYDHDLTLAAEKYLQEAYNTQDVGIAAHATKLAIYSNDKKVALSAAQLWHELAPEEINAATIFADLLIQSGEALHGLNILAKFLSASSDVKFNSLHKVTLPAGERQIEQLIESMQHLVNDFPGHFELSLSLAVLRQKNQQAEQALQLLKQLSSDDRQRIEVITKSAELIHQLEGPRHAADYLAQRMKKGNDHFSLQYYHAKLLSQFNLPGAEKAFAQLLETHSNDVRLLFSHALIAFENKSFGEAKQSFEQLLVLQRQTNASYFHLGRIAEYNHQPTEAEHFFRQVGKGTYFMPATLQLVTLQASSGKIDKARTYLTSLRKTNLDKAPQFWALEAELLNSNGDFFAAYGVLNQAILAFPEQLMLRLERSFISERLDDFLATEKDLRFVLDRDPKNITALNALGYMLTNHTQRYEEALTLIHQAIALRPNDGAIIDSLGWVQYHLGDWKVATQNLERAFKILPDDEVAAHLIEVYWEHGATYKARRLIKKLKHSDSMTPKTDSIIKRLDISW